MRELSTIEAAAVERCADAPMLAQVEQWAAINSGSRNLAGLDAVAGAAGRRLRRPARRDRAGRPPRRSRRSAADGRATEIAHGRNLHLRVRPEAPVQLLLTGHMDTVFAADHPFQSVFWREDGRARRPRRRRHEGRPRDHARRAARGRGVAARGAARLRGGDQQRRGGRLGRLGGADRRRRRAASARR